MYIMKCKNQLLYVTYVLFVLKAKWDTMQLCNSLNHKAEGIEVSVYCHYNI